MISDPMRLTENSFALNDNEIVAVQELITQETRQRSSEVLQLNSEISELQQQTKRLENQLQLFSSELKQFRENKPGAQSPETAMNPKPTMIGSAREAGTVKAVRDLRSNINHSPEREQESNPDPEPDRNKVVNESEVTAFFGDTFSPGKPGAGEEPEVTSLKKQLEDKLRKAEVEMAIQRARVFQQKAELEEMKVHLERREKAIRKSVDESGIKDQTARWNRHFGYARKK